MSDLVLWDYYIKEELRYGPSYDLEIAGLELQQEQEVDSMTEQPSMRLTKYSMTHGKLKEKMLICLIFLSLYQVMIILSMTSLTLLHIF